MTVVVFGGNFFVFFCLKNKSLNKLGADRLQIKGIICLFCPTLSHYIVSAADQATGALVSCPFLTLPL